MAYENEDIEILSYEDGKQVLDDEKVWLATIAKNARLIDETLKEEIRSKGTCLNFGLTMYGSAVDAIRRLSSADYPVRFDGEMWLVDSCRWDTVWKHWNMTIVKYH